MWARAQNNRIHKEKLRAIRTRAPDSACTSPNTMKYFDVLQQRSAKHEQQRVKNNLTDNLRLFKKLNELHDGRHTSTNSHRSRSFADAVSSKGLHYFFKKRESKRIAQENQVMAKRLSEPVQSVDARQLHREYKKAAKYREQISRTKLLQKLETIEKQRLQKTMAASSFRATNQTPLGARTVAPTPDS